MPKVGIALATYNPDLDFFKEQLDSLKNQSFSNWVCIVSDDSTKIEIARAIQRILGNDPRFRYFKNDGKPGVIRNFENALRKIDADCDLICFCDQDDIWERFKLERMIEVLERNPKTIMTHSDLSLIDKIGNKIASSCWQIERRVASEHLDLVHLVIRNNVTGCAMMFRSHLLGLALPFPEVSKKEPYLHDHWIAVLAQSQGNVVGIAEQLIRYRQHGMNVVGASEQSLISLLKKIRKIPVWRETCLKALHVRQQLAVDLIARIRSLNGSQADDLETKFRPLLEPSSMYFLKNIFRNISQAQLWVALFIGSLLQGSKK